MSHVVAVKNICEREEISRDVNSHLVEKVAPLTKKEMEF